MDEFPNSVKESYRERALKVIDAGEAIKISSERCCESSCCQPEVGDLLPPSFGCVVDFIEGAGIGEGDVVVDFGSGPGHDVLQAVQKVGPGGSVIGVDFTPEMVELAMKNTKGIDNVAIVLGDIQNVPLEDGLADVVVSNCVVNLVVDKGAVFKEAFRLLKEGGRVVVADMITAGSTEGLTNSDYCACVGGAVSKDEYVGLMENAGFVNITYSIVGRDSYRSEKGLEVPYESVVFKGFRK